MAFLLSGLLSEVGAQNPGVQDNLPEQTIFRPPVVCTLPKEVEETSGLIFWRNNLWTHNDSGGLPVIYCIDTLTGKVLQRITLKKATNMDWEDITQDSLFIYVGDMGNNSGNRRDLVIYKIKKGDIPLLGDADVTAEKIAFSYPDYKGPVKNRKHNNFDGESLMTAGDSLYLFSKDWQDQQSRLYALPKMPGTYVARLISKYNVHGLITGADYQPATGTVALTGYTRGDWVPFVLLLTKFKGDNFFSGSKIRIDMPKAKASQTEAVAFAERNQVYVSSEGRAPVFKQTLYSFSLESWLGSKAVAVPYKAPAFDFVIRPHKLQQKKNTLYLRDFPQRAFTLQLLDANNRQMMEYHFKTGDVRGKSKIKINLPVLKQGLYTIRMIVNSQSVEHRFMKK